MLPHLAHTAHKLYAATSEKIKKFKRTDELNSAYEACKSMLEKDIMQTTFEGHKNIVVYTDASKYAVCAVITQNGRIIIAMSKVLCGRRRNWSTIEREMFTISWMCKKFRVYLHGVKFTVRTDHKPLLGIFKKVDAIENMRMISMVLSTAEFCFNLEYYPGVRNILADFGTRFIDLSEWDEPEAEDPLELNEFYNFEALTELPSFSAKDLSASEMDKVNKLGDESNRMSGDFLEVLINDIWYILVPEICWRAMFWHYHYPRHMGVTKMIELLKSAGYWWFDMTDALLDVLSTSPVQERSWIPNLSHIPRKNQL